MSKEKPKPPKEGILNTLLYAPLGWLAMAGMIAIRTGIGWVLGQIGDLWEVFAEAFPAGARWLIAIGAIIMAFLSGGYFIGLITGKTGIMRGWYWRK